MAVTNGQPFAQVTSHVGANPQFTQHPRIELRHLIGWPACPRARLARDLALLSAQ
jgi:hypothetical protein